MVPIRLFCDMQVKFDLYLPFRLQEKHLHPIKCKTFTENFKVTINPNYFGIPVVIIELVDPSEEPEPSCSVAAIRKFLEHELPDNDESVIYLDFLGPSPFHANVYLSLKDSADSGDETCEYFEVDVQRRRGYDSICIQANPDIFESLDDAKDFFIYSAIDELSHYYWVIQYKIRRDDQWDDLRRQAEDITSRLGKKGWAGLREKFINLPFILDSAVKSLVEFEIDKIIWDRGQSSCYHDTYDSGEDIPIFKSYIDNELSNIPNYPVNRLSELINFVEGRRAKGVELLVIMVAGLLGGAVGSILTLAFAK